MYKGFCVQRVCGTQECAGQSRRWAVAAAMLDLCGGISVPAIRWPGAAVSRVPRLKVAAAEVPTSRSAPAAVVFSYSIYGACDFLKHSLPSLSLIVPSL